MKILKKNQIVVFVIGIMIIAAGYLSYTNNDNNSLEDVGALVDSEEMASIGDAKLVSANVVENNITAVNIMERESIQVNETGNVIDSNTIKEDNDIKTSSNIVHEDEYFAKSRLERNTMYSQQIENYQDILSNTNVNEAQKKIAQEEINKINDEQNAIMIAENLIKTKGIEDLIIFVNDKSINVIVKGEKLEKDEIAQIQNIITRELESDIANIHIMNKE